MKLSDIKNILPTLDKVAFQLEDGTWVPAHFHVTEVGVVTKDFIDCGGTIRHEQTASLQLWFAGDENHSLAPLKLLSIIRLSEEKLGMGDLEVEVEYQGTTIGKYGLEFNGRNFVLKNTTTACLAEDACGITPVKKKVALADLQNNNGCNPGSGCCA